MYNPSVTATPRHRSTVQHGRLASCAKRTCDAPCFTGLTSRCFAHRARASCAPFAQGSLLESGTTAGSCPTQKPPFSRREKGGGTAQAVTEGSGGGTAQAVTESANADSSPYTGEPFGKWYAVGSSTAQKPPFFQKGGGTAQAVTEGSGGGTAQAVTEGSGGGTAQAVTEGLTPLSRLAPAAFHNSQWSFRCAHKFACGSPLFIGLTSRCFAHSARASCAPFRKGEPFGAQAATISRIFRTSF